MKKLKIVLPILAFLVATSCKQEQEEKFHFYVATDVHMITKDANYTNWCFRDEILPDIKMDSETVGNFIVVTGDMDPFFRVKESVSEVMGKEFRFYPVIGNHDVGMTNNNYEKFPEANWGNTFDIVKYNKSNLKKIDNWGPCYRTMVLDSIVYKDTISGKEYISTYDSLNVTGSKYTTYSFDEGNSHFVVLDIYSGMPYFTARGRGRITNQLYDWLADDLEKTDKKNVFVFAHQPFWNTSGESSNSLVNVAYKEFCRDSARSYGADSLAWFEKEYTAKIRSREEIWGLLKRNNVLAYFCGHTHHYSVKKVDGIWEINLEFGAWGIEGRTRYGKIIVDKSRVELLVEGYIEKTERFETLDRIILKD